MRARMHAPGPAVGNDAHCRLRMPFPGAAADAYRQCALHASMHSLNGTVMSGIECHHGVVVHGCSCVINVIINVIMHTASTKVVSATQ